MTRHREVVNFDPAWARGVLSSEWSAGYLHHACELLAAAVEAAADHAAPPHAGREGDVPAAALWTLTDSAKIYARLMEGVGSPGDRGIKLDSAKTKLRRAAKNKGLRNHLKS